MIKAITKVLNGNKYISEELSQSIAGINYYRIVQVNIDGKRSSTSIENLQFDCANGIVKYIR